VDECTLVPFPAQCTHFLWDTLGGFSDQNRSGWQLEPTSGRVLAPTSTNSASLPWLSHGLDTGGTLDFFFLRPGFAASAASSAATRAASVKGPGTSSRYIVTSAR
jgi:hypothetical protein